MSLAELLTPAEMAEFHLSEEDDMRRGLPFNDENFSDAVNDGTAEDYVNPVEIVCEAIVTRVMSGFRVQDILTRPDYVLIFTAKHRKWLPYIKETWLSATDTVEEGRWRGMEPVKDDKRQPVGVAEVVDRVDERQFNVGDCRKTMARCAIVGRPCLVFTCWPKADYLTDDITMLTDAELYLQPTAADIRKAYQEMGGKEPDGGIISEELAAQLTPWSVAASYRAGMTADRWIERLERITVAQTDAAQREAEVEAEKKSSYKPKTRKVEHVDLTGTPPLEDRHGMGAFSEWGSDLKRDLEAYRQGKLSWNMVDTGVLLSGPPGVGKTSAVRSLAVSLGVKLVAGSYSLWIGHGDGHQGTLLSGMRATFAAARESGEPTLLFIDEIDSFGTRDKGETDEHHRNWLAGSIGGLLQEIDGIQGKGRIILVGATNRPKEIDSAILRAGRLDKHVEIPLPNAEGLAAILRSYLGNECPDADLLLMGHELIGSTGADCEQVTRNARRFARKHNRPLRTEDLVLAVRGVDERTPGQLFADSVHEAAHAFLSEHLHPGSVMSATVRKTDTRLGGVAIKGLPHSCSDADMQARIRVLLAGRAADEVLNLCIDAGAVGDLGWATLMAAQYVLSYGFAKREAGMRFRGNFGPEDLPKVLKDNPDAAVVVENILATEYEKAVSAMKVHARTVTELAAKLAREKTLTGEQVRELIETSKKTPSTYAFQPVRETALTGICLP